MKVGFIGVGAMGHAMAGHMIQRGRDEVFAYDINPERVKAAAEIGAKTVSSLEEMARAADLFIVMVISDQQVVEVATELSASAAKGSLIVVASTVHPDTMKKAAEPVAQAGLRLVDAPVVFGLVGAQDGNLVSLCGGSEEDVEAVRDALMAYCRAVHHVGALGAGQLAKTVNNMISWAASLANFEGLLLAKRYGVDPQRMREIIDDCPAQNMTLKRWDTSRFTWQEKDMDIVMEMAQDGGLIMPFYGHVDQLIKLLSAGKVSDLLYGESVEYLGRKVALGKLEES